MKTCLTSLEDSRQSREQSEGREPKADLRSPDWRFSVLADFEDLLRSYGQDHFSSACLR